jgi:hypothetical protein
MTSTAANSTIFISSSVTDQPIAGTL